MTRSAIRLALALVLLAVVGAAPGAARGSPAVPGPVVIGQFATPCLYSHRAMDDPIVFPGQPGMSHMHDFIGNVSTNAFSTLQRMRAGSTRCFRLPDTSGYWVPTLFQNGISVDPDESAIYYQSDNKVPKSIVPFPAGLKMIVGDAHATEPPDPAIVDWHCDVPGLPSRYIVPTCAPETDLDITFTFPDCWDGRHLDSADHKSHMAYAEQTDDGLRVCPDTHPVPVPRIMLIVKYPTPGGRGVRLASGSPITAHADFFNAWDQKELAALVKHCLNENRICDQNENGDSGPLDI